MNAPVFSSQPSHICILLRKFRQEQTLSSAPAEKSEFTKITQGDRRLFTKPLLFENVRLTIGLSCRNHRSGALALQQETPDEFILMPKILGRIIRSISIYDIDACFLERLLVAGKREIYILPRVGAEIP